MFSKRILKNSNTSFTINNFAYFRNRVYLFCLIFFVVFPIFAEEKTIDGIKFRIGMNTYSDDLNIDGIGNVAQKNKYINSSVIFDQVILNNPELGNYQRGDEAQSNFVITLPETLINSFMFRGANIDWIYMGKITDLPPADGSNQIITLSSGETLLRQDTNMIRNLENNFFNIKDRAFTSSHPNYWALSADITKNALLIGYSLGFFIPIDEKNRFFKISYGLGLGIYEYIVDLNLCEKYSLSKVGYESKEKKNYYDGKCVGKVQIDEAKLSGYYSSTFQSATVWQRITKDSIISLFTIESSQGSGVGESNLMNHYKNITTNVLFNSIEFFSYTFRF